MSVWPSSVFHPGLERKLIGWLTAHDGRAFHPYMEHFEIQPRFNAGKGWQL